MSNDPTSEATLEEESNPDDINANVVLNLEDAPTETKETEENEETPKNEPDYKTRYAESTKEAQRLIRENKELQLSKKELEARLAKFEAEKNKIEEAFKSEKPEEYAGFKEKSELDSIRKEMALLKEDNAINAYIVSNPEAKNHKQVLQSLKVAHPNMSYSDLWDTIVKPLMEAGMESAGVKRMQKRSSQPETGKDSRADSFENNTDLQSFKKLPRDKQRKIVEKLSSGDFIL